MIYLDLETTANEQIIKFLPEPTPPGNYKKPESIARWMAEAKQKQAEKAALDLDCARIISIGVADGDDGIPHGWAVPTDERQSIFAEQGVVRSFWIWLNDSLDDSTPRLAGYNIRNFDLPILLRRTWQFDLVPPINIMPILNRASGQVVDLMELLYHQGYTSTRYRGLKDVCKMYGIENPLPDMDGSMVGELTADELLAYNLNDVALTRELARRTEGYYWFDK